MDDEAGPFQLETGKVIGRRWKVVDKLGEGGCGAVYLVADTRSNAKAALKAENNNVPGGPVLKLEAQILRRMQGRKHVAQLLAAGKKERYSYIVMTLVGPSLSKLFRQCGKEFTVSTQVRLGAQILYGLKQLHEVGYIHRDVKPANLAIGRRGSGARVVYLLDFGLSREYVLRNAENKLEMRRPRENTLFRGTTKYCSANTHTRSEQGRPDDLWSMLYVLAEMRHRLPWEHCHDKQETYRIKSQTADEKLLSRSPPELIQVAAHLRTLDYYKRPDYFLIYSVFTKIMEKKKIKFTDKFDWELKGQQSTLAPEKTQAARTVTEDPSVMRTVENGTPEQHTAEEVDKAVVTEDDFKKNELGF